MQEEFKCDVAFTELKNYRRTSVTQLEWPQHNNLCSLLSLCGSVQNHYRNFTSQAHLGHHFMPLKNPKQIQEAYLFPLGFVAAFFVIDQVRVSFNLNAGMLFGKGLEEREREKTK